MLEGNDPEIFEAIEKEKVRQMRGIELIASENYVSEEVLEATGSILTNKYAEGYPGHRYYGGCEYVDVIENLAKERAVKLFGADHANVQPHSGSQANMGVYMSVLKPGDTILGMDLSSGGHLTHGGSMNFSGKIYNAISYGLHSENELLDYEGIEKLAVNNQPKMIVAGASAYPRKIDFAKFKLIADKVGAYLMVDMAHIAGLVAAGVHESPVPYADFVTSTAHKTLRGPRSGFILCKEKYAKDIDKSIFPGIQGGPLEHVIAAKAVAFAEALKPDFKIYIERVVKNTKILGDVLMEEGFELVSGGTDNHLILVKLVAQGITGQQAEDELGKVHITVNKNGIPNDPQPKTVTSGIRIGGAAVTTRGFDEEDMEKIGHIIADVLRNIGKENVYRDAREKVQMICSKYPVPGIREKTPSEV